MTFRITLLLITIIVSHCLTASILPRATPESQGISSESILNLIQAADDDLENDFHSLMILRHGKIVAEGYWSPFKADHQHELFSLSKSFTSTAIGLAIEEGLFSLDTPVIDFFKEDIDIEFSEHQKALRIRQLLTMDTGHLHEADIFNPKNYNTPLIQQFFEHPIELKPGTHFTYNTAATYMLSAIIQKTTGQRVLDYLTPRLFNPLGIEGPKWDQCPAGIDFGGFGLHLKTADIARFGQLLLNRGEWEGTQIVPENWVQIATSKQVSNGNNPESDWDQGYGFQFWMNKVGGFRGDGAFGQFCIVLPEYDLVIAATASSPDMGTELNWIWDNILPELSDTPKKENTKIQNQLTAKLASLELKHPVGTKSSPMGKNQSGKVFRFEKNPFRFQSIAFDFNSENPVLIIEESTRTSRTTVGYNEWIEGTTVQNPIDGELPSYFAGAWKDDSTFEVSVIMKGRAPKQTAIFTFNENTVRVKVSTNVGFGPTEFPAFKGIAE